MLLFHILLSCIGAKPRSLSQGYFLRFDPKVRIMFLLGTFLFAGLCCTTIEKKGKE